MNAHGNQIAQIDARQAAHTVAKLGRKTRIGSEGLEWTVLELGQGEQTLVFLPGTLGTVEIFSKQLLYFSRACRVLVLGYPGNPDKTSMTASFYARLEELRIAKAHFIGSSLGAYWLQVFTHDRDDVAESLVLCNTFADAEPLQNNPLFVRAFLASTNAEHVKDAWLKFVDGLPPSELRDLQQACVGPFQPAEELRGRAMTIAHAGRTPLSSVPAARITLLSCADDPIISKAMADAMGDAYPEARHVRLQNGGHYPHVSNTAAYNAVIAEACRLAN
jgi:maspardin